MKFLQPADWKAPKGYSNGVLAQGKHVFVAGQIGWNKDCVFEELGLLGQIRQALSNVLSVLQTAGAGPEHVTRLTWYLKSKHEYLKQSKEIGVIYREIMGRHYPAMSLVVVADLLEDQALVEIEASAVVP
jgi:enamine deaminase RidA (YjgF/YER057c/UK114 family)